MSRVSGDRNIAVVWSETATRFRGTHGNQPEPPFQPRSGDRKPTAQPTAPKTMAQSMQ